MIQLVLRGVQTEAALWYPLLLPWVRNKKKQTQVE